jgi:hypothetical protein
MEQADSLWQASKGVSRTAIEEAARNYDAKHGLSFPTTVQDKLASKRTFLKNFNFNKYIEQYLGPMPHDGWHTHHILYKWGLGEGQQAIVAEGQAILREAGIHPVFGPEMFVWAPQRAKGQHHITSLTEVVEK